MIGLVVTGHGLFAEGMRASAKMIAGNNEYIRYICFEEGMNPKDLAAKFHDAYSAFSGCDGIIVLSDLAGGTPFKTAAECAFAHPDKQIIVLCGINLPMILSASFALRDATDPQALAEMLLAEGRESVIRFSFAPHEDTQTEDGI